MKTNNWREDNQVGSRTKDLWKTTKYREKMKEARQKFEKQKIKLPFRNELNKKYNNALYRCNNPKALVYKSYGGRGIKVEWECFDDFYRDMVSTYKEGLSLERIDVNGNYSKKNCKWITKKEQYHNRQSTIIIKYNNIKVPLTSFVEKMQKETGLSHTYFTNRVKRSKSAGMEVKFILNLIAAAKDKQKEEIILAISDSYINSIHTSNNEGSRLWRNKIINKIKEI